MLPSIRPTLLAKRRPPLPPTVAAYSFDAGLGAGVVINDDSGNGNDLSLVQSATTMDWQATSKYGTGSIGGTKFNGYDTYVGAHKDNLASWMPTGSTMTISFWARIDATTQDYNTILSCNNASSDGRNSGIQMLIYPGFVQIPVSINNTTVYAPSTPEIRDGLWHHYAIVVDETTLSTYMDGVSTGAPTSRPAGNITYLPDGIFTVGGNAAASSPISGLFDNLRIYNVALTPDQVTQDMATPISSSGLAPITSPVIVGDYSTASVNGVMSMQIITSANTKIGDLVVIAAYVEPVNQGSAGASYGTNDIPVTPQVGITIVPGYPCNTDDATMTVNRTHRLYVWYWRSTADGSTTLTFNCDNSSIYWGLASIVVRGAPQSGYPFADNTSINTTSSIANGITATPSVSLNLAGANSLVLWIYGDWQGDNPGSPAGYTNNAFSTNHGGQPAIASKLYASAGNTGIVTAPRLNARNGMTAGMLSIRMP